MRSMIYAVVTVLVLQVASTRAEKVMFECDANLFETTSATAPAVNLFDYTAPLYEGLWPMTIEAFRRCDGKNDDREILTFNIASR